KFRASSIRNWRASDVKTRDSILTVAVVVMFIMLGTHTADEQVLGQNGRVAQFVPPDLCRRFLCSVLRSARKSERKSYGHVDSFGNGKAVAHGAALERCRTHVYGFGCREITGLSSCGAHTRTSGGRPVVVTSAHRTLCRGFRGSDRKPGRAT